MAARLNAERQRQGVSMEELAEKTGAELSEARVWRILEGGGVADLPTLLTIANALGRRVDWLVNPELDEEENEWGAVGRGQLPIVAVGQARTGSEILFEPLEPPYEMEDLKGLVLGTVLDDSLLDLAGEGQRVMLDPTLHPDDAPPHKDFKDPIALVRYRDRSGDEHWVYKRWHRISKQKVRLITVRKDRVGPDGFPEHFELRDNRILQAWTVRGVLW
jgi:transcriptional regulator with XRE-family HTH domain